MEEGSMKRDNRYVIVDTREKKPWSFRQQKRKKVNGGDYTIYKGTKKVVIERKSFDDLFLTLSKTHWKRFRTKMGKAVEEIDSVFIFIEASLSQIMRGTKYTERSRQMTINRIIELMGIGVQIIFTGGGKKGPVFAEMLLRKLGE